MRPAHLRSSITPFSTVATPAESYPRYSSRRKPSSRIGVASALPIYPIIPHISKNHRDKEIERLQDASKPRLLRLELCANNGSHFPAERNSFYHYGRWCGNTPVPSDEGSRQTGGAFGGQISIGR